MHDTLEKPKTTTALSEAPGWWSKLARSAVLDRLASFRHGKVTITEGSTRTHCGGDGPRVQVTVHDQLLYKHLLHGGSLAAAEAYMGGLWTTDDLVGLLRLFLRNADVMDSLDRGMARATVFAGWLAQILTRRNTRNGSQRNIHAHYDLGNDFFALFLDPTLSYSCGYFDHPKTSMEDASIAKLERVCRKLDLHPSDHLLEIGTGWGGLALHAAAHFGCRVTTTTISREQYELACQRVQAAGLQNRVTVLRHDYRDLTGRFDKLVSIEMIEAVGHSFLETFFRQCGRLLAPNGVMLLQAITIGDQRYRQHLRSADFMQRYIFPGSCLPSVTALSNAMTNSSDLQLVDLEDITPHYVLTLRHWRRRFVEQLGAVRALAYSERFIRMWEYYLCASEAGFAERYLGDVQMLLSRPDWRSRHHLALGI